MARALHVGAGAARSGLEQVAAPAGFVGTLAVSMPQMGSILAAGLVGDAVGTNNPTKGHWPMRRFMLLAVAGVLGLVALPDARGQGQPGATDKGKVRVLAVGRTPLADEHLAEGGLIVALVRASLAQSGSGGYSGADLDLRWTKAAPTPPRLDAAPFSDLVLPVEAPDCDQPNTLTQSLAVLCDSAVFSDALLQIVVGLFTPAGSTLKFDSDQAIFGKTICVAQDQDVASLNADGRSWVSLKQVTVMRRATLLDCVAEVQVQTAHAFAATDLEGRFLLTRIGLAQAFLMQPRPLATRGVHAVVARESPKAEELIAAINRGLKKLKEGGAHSAIVQKHMAHMWDGSASRPPPAFANTAAAAKRGPDKMPDKTKEPAGAVPEPELKVPPVLSAAERERAMRFMKKGEEELADGRVASARLLFERAAEMGIAQGAMALAGTYDVDELAKLNLTNLTPDAAQAKRWYERALQLGEKAAGQRLQRLVGASTKQ
jgi:hypothetical protein